MTPLRLGCTDIALAGHNRVITYSPVAVAVARAFKGKYE